MPQIIIDIRRSRQDRIAVRRLLKAANLEPYLL